MRKVWTAQQAVGASRSKAAAASEQQLVVRITLDGRVQGEASACERTGDMFSLVGVLVRATH
jgi:hypothetical protein